MNVFVLPSWYPSATVPMAGLFARDQARALARVRPGWPVTVGLWGHHDGALSLRSLRATARALAWRVRARSGWRDTPDHLHEVTTPRLSWSLLMAGGGAAGLLSASRRNLASAEARFGPMSLLHAHVGFPGGWIAARLAAERGLPYVLTEHMGPFPFHALRKASGRPQPALYEAFRQAAAVVAVSPALAEDIRAAGLPCSDVIPNVVDETRFALSAPVAPVADAPFVFFTLGALVPHKGVDLLLQALALVRANARSPATRVHLHVGGDGPERAALQAQSAALGLEGCVRWLGALAPEAVPAQMSRCDAFVLASRHETFGVVLAEALMAGKPLLATRSGGPTSVVHSGNGLLVEPGDVPALAAAMEAYAAGSLRHDPARLRAEAVARYGMAAVGEQLARLYARVVAR